MKNLLTVADSSLPLLFFIDIRAEPMATCGAIARQVEHRLRPVLLCYMLPPSCIAHSCRILICVFVFPGVRGRRPYFRVYAASIFPGVRGVHFVSMDCVNFYLIARPLPQNRLPISHEYAEAREDGLTFLR